MKYYALSNRFTVLTHERWIVSKLDDDLDFLFRCVKSIVIHPLDAQRERVKFDRSKSGYFHAITNTVDRILAYPGLHQELENRNLPLETSAQDRAVLSCDHHALLLASFLRALGISVRVKTGFAKYLVPNRLVPHWVVEIYDSKSDSWILVDPERRKKRVPREDFLFAHQAWAFFQKDDRAIPSYSSLAGTQGLKYALFCELNCVFKNELLAYEWRVSASGTIKPEIVRLGYDRLDSEQKDDLASIAELLKEPDRRIRELWTLYVKYRIDLDTSLPIL